MCVYVFDWKGVGRQGMDWAAPQFGSMGARPRAAGAAGGDMPVSEEPRQRMRKAAQAAHPRQGFRSEQKLPSAWAVSLGGMLGCVALVWWLSHGLVWQPVSAWMWLLKSGRDLCQFAKTALTAVRPDHFATRPATGRTTSMAPASAVRRTSISRFEVALFFTPASPDHQGERGNVRPLMRCRQFGVGCRATSCVVDGAGRACVVFKSSTPRHSAAGLDSASRHLSAIRLT